MDFIQSLKENARILLQSRLFPFTFFLGHHGICHLMHYNLHI